MKRVLLGVLIGLLLPVTGAFGESDPWNGNGWTMTRLDLEVRVDKDAPALAVEGIMTLRLDRETSLGPTLWINSSKAGMEWRAVTGNEVADVRLSGVTEEMSSDGTAEIRLKKPAARGDEIALRFAIDQVAESSQLITRGSVALASWVEAWYPVAEVDSGDGRRFSARLLSVPGTTTLDLPGDWIAISDGALASRERRSGRTVEVWDLTKRPVARSFAAGPFREAEHAVDGRMIRIDLLQEHEFGVDALAELIAASLAAQERRLGPFPFEGYGVVEIPNGAEEWGAASQQTFIMAKSENLELEHGNLPLWAHEMCHGWWGNTVGASGPGRKMVDEALAQFGVLISLEALEGTDAMIEFLEFSRSGYNTKQCARGYFELAEQGKDYPLARLGESGLPGGTTHNLADSKGMWVYHMLRRKIGDDRFFATLRGLIDEYAGRELTLDGLRASFLSAAPDQDLDRFFSQWLDRAGAPRIDVSWSMPTDDLVHVVLTETGDGEPFVLDAEVELVFRDGTTRQETVHVDGRETLLDRTVSSRVTDVLVDPDRDLLLWRPTYATPPSVDGVPLPAVAPWVDNEVFVGVYHVAMFGVDAEVFGNEKGLFVDVDGDVQQLYPHKPYRFLTHDASVEFTVENGKATGFVVEIANGTVAEGVRVDSTE